MKAEHLPPTLPRPQETPAPRLGGSAVQGLLRGQEDGAATASLEGTAGLRVLGLPHLLAQPPQPLQEICRASNPVPAPNWEPVACLQ